MDMKKECYDPLNDSWLLQYEISGSQYTPIFKRKMAYLRKEADIEFDTKADLTFNFPLDEEFDGVSPNNIVLRNSEGKVLNNPSYNNLMRDNVQIMRTNYDLKRRYLEAKQLITVLIRELEKHDVEVELDYGYHKSKGSGRTNRKPSGTSKNKTKRK